MLKNYASIMCACLTRLAQSAFRLLFLGIPILVDLTPDNEDVRV